MFTGIIQHSGTIDSLDRHANGARLTLRVPAEFDLQRGESVAVNGVCLTMLPQDDGSIVADVSDETLRLTTLGTLAPMTRVNLERALAVGDRLGGHIVQGHVDAAGTLLSIAQEGAFAVYRWSFPTEFAELVVPKGSIAVDGVSLTIVDPDAASFGAALIPETLTRTNLGDARPGDAVNLEFDVIAKHIRALVAPYLRK
jgi:riboflavin synthase